MKDALTIAAAHIQFVLTGECIVGPCGSSLRAGVQLLRDLLGRQPATARSTRSAVGAGHGFWRSDQPRRERGRAGSEAQKGAVARNLRAQDRDSVAAHHRLSGFFRFFRYFVGGGVKRVNADRKE